MGTRGAFGFVIDEVEKIQYVHFDAYPQGLGADVLAWVHDVTGLDVKSDAERDASWVEVRERVRALRVVTDADEPTPDDVQQLARWHDPTVDRTRADGATPSWYQLLRGTQGRPVELLEAGIVEDAASFPLDSLYCEWAYVVNLDASAGGALEAYRGFQTEPHRAGRFATRARVPARVGVGGATYQPVKLVRAWSLALPPTVDVFLETLSG